MKKMMTCLADFSYLDGGGLRWFLISVGALSLLVLAGTLADIYVGAKKLGRFRAGLKRGDMVELRGCGEQEVWTNHLDGRVTLRLGSKEDGYYYKKVDMEEIFPVPDRQEWEIV